MCKCDQKTVELREEEALAYEKELTKIALRDNGWTRLFKCESCNAYWEETRPQSERQGGGPVVLTRVSKEYVAHEWGIRE